MPRAARVSAPMSQPVASKRRKRPNVQSFTIRRIERERKLAKTSGYVAPDGPALTLRDAAQRFGIKAWTLRKKLLAGEISYYRDGIQLRVTVAEMERYMAARFVFCPATAAA